jgi:hypothetical protein
VIGQIKHYEKLVVLFIIILGVSGWFIRRLGSKRQRRNPNQIEKEVEITPAKSSKGGIGVS